MAETPMVGARIPQNWQQQTQEIAKVSGRKEAEVVREVISLPSHPQMSRTVIATENLDPLSLPSLPLLSRRQLPECTATYFVLDSDTKAVLYIGVTKNLLRRWTKHQKLKDIPYSALIAWLEVENLNIARAFEYKLIKKFNPVLNNGYNPVPPNPAGIRILRQKADLSFKEVASATQLSIKMLEAWERGNIIPKFTVEQIAIICELYKCTISELRVGAKETLENPWIPDIYKVIRDQVR